MIGLGLLFFLSTCGQANNKTMTTENIELATPLV